MSVNFKLPLAQLAQSSFIPLDFFFNLFYLFIYLFTFILFFWTLFFIILFFIHLFLATGRVSN